MGFLKFLKREKRSDFDELDLPPAPPPLDDKEFGAQGFDGGMEFPEFPEDKISAPKEPSFDFGREEMPELENEPLEMPELPEMEERPVAMQPKTPVSGMPPITAPVQQALQPAKEEIAPEEPRFTPLGYPKMDERLFSREKKSLHERPAGKTIYVKVDKFKAALGSINVVRSDLRKSEDALMKLESIKNSKDRAFDKVRNSLDDLQKKLIFIDKTLFRED